MNTTKESKQSTPGATVDAIDKARKLRAYWLLNSSKTSESPQILGVVEHLVSEMESSKEVSVPTQGKYRRDLVDHVRVIICNLYSAYSTDPNLYIAYHGDDTKYKKNKTYKGFQFGYRNTIKVIMFLWDNGYIDWYEGKPALVPEKEGHLSKIKAEDKLIDLWQEQPQADPVSVYRDTTHDETVILKGKKTLPPKKDWKDGRKPKPRRKIITTPDRPIVRKMRLNLKEINRVIQDHHIHLDLDQFELEQLNESLSADPDKYKRAVDFTSKSLYRVFIDGSLELHGRFYGGWWEGISEDDRNLILINGMPTAELDFKSIHPHILYGLEEAPLPVTDPYYLPGDAETQKKLRPLVKGLLLIGLNAKSRSDAVAALRKKYNDKEKKARRLGKPIPKPQIEITKENMYPIIEQLREQHAPIQEHFFADRGNMLMYHDSEMAEDVMLHFARKGVPCLPVHDSFIVDIRYLDECWDAMRKAFSWRFGQEIPVDYMDFVTKANRIMDGPRATENNKDWREMASDLTKEIKGGDHLL